MSETKDMNKCHICNLKIDSDQLELHFCEVHSSENKCDNCDSFKSQEELKYHIVNTHSRSKHQKKVKDKLCQVCQKAFRTPAHLRRHMLSVHKQTLKLKCDQCEKTFQLNSLRIKHMKTDHYDPPKCDLCGKTFRYDCLVEKHKKLVHNGIKEYECSLCPHASQNSYDLKRHVRRMHDKIRNEEKCNQCERTFTEQRYLKYHVESVHDNIKTVCKHCNER